MTLVSALESLPLLFDIIVSSQLKRKKALAEKMFPSCIDPLL
jgi:hypothetical protein